MDTGEGSLKMLEKREYDQLVKGTQEGARTGSLFRVGEIVMIKESRFKIKKITPKGLTLRVLPKED
uniref:Uncharacterized protein n=1 Tax=viral metagenome TaxID=1070528 RepID=A0A6M3JJP5_9ZZZZ